jgi:pyruvate dehydrogenase E2 component (dihydrolipoamide acetyltransferase)
MTPVLDFRLPDVGEGIDAAELLAWLVAAGDEVAEDQPLAEIQTDKAIVVIPCPTSGVVAELLGEPGDTIPVGAVLARFAPAARAAPTSEAGLPSVPVAASPAAATQDAPESPAAQPAPSSSAQPPPRRRALASPAVRRMARELGVEITTVTGSGPGGRVVHADVQAARDGAVAAPPLPGATPSGDDQIVPLRGVRRAIARTLTRQWQTVPHVIDHREVDASGLVAARRWLKAAADRAGDSELAGALTVTPLIVKMCATALRRHPNVNAAVDLEREEIRLYGSVHIGIATATPDGLLVPVIRDADTKSIADIAVEIGALATAARARALIPDQLSGATFTVNNYGGLGIWLGTPIIGPGQVANLGIGRLEDRAVVRDGEVVIRPVIPLACSGDHRLLDGDTLAHFVTEVVLLMEEPAVLLGGLR